MSLKQTQIVSGQLSENGWMDTPVKVPADQELEHFQHPHKAPWFPQRHWPSKGNGYSVSCHHSQFGLCLDFVQMDADSCAPLHLVIFHSVSCL